MSGLNQRKNNEIAHGKKIAEQAERVWGHATLAGQSRVERRIELMLNLGKITGESQVLELGCGTGEFTSRLAGTKAEITGIDISPDLLMIARKRLADKPNVSFQIGDMEDLSNLPDNYYSQAVGNSVLHHVDYEKCLKILLKKLKPGGFIIFSEPNMMNPQIAITKNIPIVKKLMNDSPDETAFFRWRISGLLKKVGFRDVQVENFDFLHPYLPDVFVNTFKKILILFEKIPIIKEFSGSILIVAKK